MFKITALKNYTDLKPELIVKGNNKGSNIEKGNVYYVTDKKRAETIKASNLATVEEVVETATKKVKAETATKKTRKKKE